MPITFTCECGEKISVLDGMEGKPAVCASCRKTQRIPDNTSDDADAESASGLFREALAAFGEGAEGESAEKESASEADTTVMGGRKSPSPGEPPLALKVALEDSPESDPDAEADPDSDEIEDAEEIDFREEPEIEDAEDVSGEASSSDGDGGPETKDALPVEYAAKVLEQREIDRAIRREGEPDNPAGAFEPKKVELHGDKMKFHCRCGKRISVPLSTKKAIGRCPKCGSRLVVPKVSQAKPQKKKRSRSENEKARSAEARAENVRRATADVADRLRKRGGKKKGKKKDGGRAQRASVPARVIAALADAALTGAVLVGSFFILGGGAWTAWGVVPAAILGGAIWCANHIVVQWIMGSSIGMMVSGVRLAYPDGRPLSFGGNLVRAFAGLLLVPLAPIAIWDEERRTPADRAAGTIVLSNR